VRKLIDISCKLTDTVYFKLSCVDPLHSCGAVARAVAARSVRAATEGTLRRDFSKGQAWLDFSKGLRRDFRRVRLNIYTTATGLGFSNRFQPFKSAKGLQFRGEHYARRLARARRRRRRTARRLLQLGAGRDSRGARERHGDHCGAGSGGVVGMTTTGSSLGQR
jgi:hypothetical protein